METREGGFIPMGKSGVQDLDHKQPVCCARGHPSTYNRAERLQLPYRPLFLCLEGSYVHLMQVASYSRQGLSDFHLFFSGRGCRTLSLIETHIPERLKSTKKEK